MNKLLFFLLLLPVFSFSQDDLLDELEGDAVIDKTQNATFDALKIINIESTKIAEKSDFYFSIAHRFSSVKNGFDDLFGLDGATIKFSFFKGINEWLQLGVARSEFQKMYDINAKYRIKTQVKDGFPVTITGFSSIGINTGLKKDNLPKLQFENRLI